MKRNNIRHITACALLLALLLPQAAVAAAPLAETDETVYINLDYYGIPEQTRIVKGVSLNGHTEFTDYGDYTSVYNMSTYDEPVLSEGSVDWSLSGSGQQRFYYECVPSGAQPMQLPWTFDVSYLLNGVPVEAEACAGASGLVEINIHAVPNALANDYSKNNMMLICATGIDMSEALSINAPGAQIQSMGTYKLVVFMSLPGEENTFTVRIGSDSFESMGLIMFMAPATLSSLDILADMRDIKDRLTDSGDDLYDGLNSMLSTMQSMQSGVGILSNGISGINEVRKQLIADRGTIDPKTDEALDALEVLAGRSDSLIPELEAMKGILTSLNATTNSMLSTLEESRTDVAEYQKLLRDVKTSLGNLDDLLDDLDDETGADWLYLSQLRSAVSELQNDMNRLQSSLGNLRNSIQLDLDALQAAAGAISDPVLSALLEALLPQIANAASQLSTTLRHLQDTADHLSDLLGSADSLLANLEDINDILDDYSGLAQDFTGEGTRLTMLANETLSKVDKQLANIPPLSESLNQATSETLSAADKGKELLTALNQSLTTANELLNSVQQTLRSVREQSDASLQASLDGLIDILQKAANSSSSGSLQNANSSIHQALDDAKKDLEEDTNMLNLDSAAELQSVTSALNPPPASLQYILRTHEISIDEAEADAAPEEAASDEGVLGRIGNIFKKLFSAVAGVFASDE